jgi:hypothetical protein
MIKVTYTKICDICKTECGTESFDCTSHLGGGKFPVPQFRYTYQFGGVIELCDECATPLFKAKQEIIDKYVRARGQS